MTSAHPCSMQRSTAGMATTVPPPILQYADSLGPAREVLDLQKRLQRCAERCGGSMRAVPTGSILQGTATYNSDADVLMVCGREVTRDQANRIAQQFEDELKKEYPGATVTCLAGKKAKHFDITLPSGHKLEGDIAFEYTTYAPLVVRGTDPRFEQRPAARQAVKLCKEMQRLNTDLSSMDGFQLEALVLYADNLGWCHWPQPKPPNHPWLRTLQLLEKHKEGKKELGALMKLTLALRPYLPASAPFFITDGQLSNWANHAGRLLKALQHRRVESRGDVEALLAGRVEELPLLQPTPQPTRAAAVAAGVLASRAVGGVNSRPAAVPTSRTSQQAHPVASISRPLTTTAVVTPPSGLQQHMMRNLHMQPVAAQPAIASSAARASQAAQQACIFCSKTYGLPADLEQHMRDKHGQRTTSEGRLVCPQCPKLFDGPAHLEQHMRDAHGQRTSSTGRLVCRQCPRLFDSPAQLEQHMRDAHGKR